MRKFIFFLALSSTIVFTSCKGDPGPPGPAGYDGDEFLAQVFEVTVNNYQYDTSVNQLYSNFSGFPFTVYESDVVLAYHWEGEERLDNGEYVDIWTLMPQNVFYNDGTGDFFQYNFNHTFLDIQFTIEGNFPLTNIDSRDVTNQLFRVAVVPAEFARMKPSMNDIMERMQMDDSEVERVEL